MRILYCLCLAFLWLSPVWAQPLPLLPYPKQLELQQGEFVFTDQLKVQLPTGQPELKTAVKRFIQQSHVKTRLDFTKNDKAQLLIQLNATTTATARQMETYQLEVSNNQIRLSALHATGIKRGLQTLQQLIKQQANRTVVPALRIDDEPRFSWRGLLLDPARRFLPLTDIKRQLDLMAAVKLNVLHLHLTDDQGWRFESKVFPKLQQVGGKDGYYTQDELKELVSYAKERGIRVVPEIDVPGHTTALGLAYPHLMTAPAPTDAEIHWGVHAAVLDPSNEQVYPFLQQLLTELAQVFPDPYVHIGGDEVLSDRWDQNNEVQAFMQQHQLADAGALQAYFNRRVEQILKSLGKTMIGWDEVLDDQLPSSVVVQSWRGTESLFQAAEKGHPAILSTGFYLDQPQTAAYHYRNDPLPDSVSAPERDQITSWSGWNFQFERKRGSPVSGSLYVLQLKSGQQQAFIQFPGKMLIKAKAVQVKAGHTNFQFDSWMGPVKASLQLNDTVQGKFVVGNAPYQLTGQAIASTQQSSLPLDAHRQLSTEAQQQVLGGEIALWGELITPELIDIRLWPNGFAVAERLWSPKSRNDEQDFYQRMELVQLWAQDFIGLQSQQQQIQGFKQLVPASHLADLLTLAETLEPAHYYHRLHEKSVAGLYHQQAPLNQLVDFLPAEHQALRQFEQDLELWLVQKKPQQLSQLHTKLRHWQQAAQRLAKTPKIAATPLFHQIAELCQAGLDISNSIAAHQPLSVAERQQITQQTEAAAAIQQEMIIALHRAITTLLQATAPVHN
ncbi:beta-N-acetylhexosaminidase [Rheinheimera soli]|uniref:beta-N-acetylhexosaminidase n=1 Tax=Rheinheimera soli TaxID=443616 RepID=UPI001E53BCB8|nr:family 20 glycosylhydrolase [Rheinheimera soli]